MFPFSRLSARFSPFFFPLLPFLPFLFSRVRSRTKRENFKLEKPRSENKGRDDAWEEENKGSSLVSLPRRAARLCDEVEVWVYGGWRGGREEDVALILYDV